MIKKLIEADNGISGRARVLWMLGTAIAFPASFFLGMELWELIHDCAFAIEKFN